VAKREAPRIEMMEGMVSQNEYATDLRWRVFTDMEDGYRRSNVLMSLGGRWTIIDGAVFKRLAENILAEL